MFVLAGLIADITTSTTGLYHLERENHDQKDTSSIVWHMPGLLGPHSLLTGCSHAAMRSFGYCILVRL